MGQCFKALQWRLNNCWFRYYPVHYCENCVLSKYTSSQFSLFSLKVNGIFYESWQVQSPSRVMSLCKTEVSKHPPPPQGQLLSKYSPVGVIGGGDIFWAEVVPGEGFPVTKTGYYHHIKKIYYYYLFRDLHISSEVAVLKNRILSERTNPSHLRFKDYSRYKSTYFAILHLSIQSYHYISFINHISKSLELVPLLNFFY